MSERVQPPRAKRALAWIILVLGIGAWLFSETLFPGNSRLYDAITNGDIATVRQLLTRRADPNSSAEPLTLMASRTRLRKYQMPPLIYALWRDKADVALALIESGADPNTKGPDGRTALTMARSHRMDAVVQALQSRGAH